MTKATSGRTLDSAGRDNLAEEGIQHTHCAAQWCASVLIGDWLRRSVVLPMPKVRNRAGTCLKPASVPRKGPFSREWLFCACFAAEMGTRAVDAIAAIRPYVRAVRIRRE